MSFFEKKLFFFRGYTQALFFIALVIYVWFDPPSDIFEGTWIDTLIDLVGICSLVVGSFLRIWSVSHTGKCARSRRLKASLLVTTGPYAHIRNPIYVGNFFIGLGLVVLSEAFFVIPFYWVLFAFQYQAIISAEEEFLQDTFGEEFNRYCESVPRYIPKVVPRLVDFSLGKNFPAKELGTVSGVILGAFFFEWIESTEHRSLILTFYHWLVP